MGLGCGLGLSVLGLSALGLSACSTHEWYVVPSTHQVSAVPTPDLKPVPASQTVDDPLGDRASSQAWIQAVRRSDGQSVWLRPAAIDWRTATAVPGAKLQVRASASNPALTAGSTLTWVGTAISLVGSGLFLAGRVRGDEALFLAGSFTALAAEPIMWAGIGYWLAGTLRPPYESPSPSPRATLW